MPFLTVHIDQYTYDAYHVLAIAHQRPPVEEAAALLQEAVHAAMGTAFPVAPEARKDEGDAMNHTPDQEEPLPLDDATIAAAAFVETMVPRGDGKAAGVYPSWHGWALREAFLAGTQWQKEQEANNQERTPDPERPEHYRLFHLLWGECKDGIYTKQQWIACQRALEQYEQRVQALLAQLEGRG